MEIERGQWQKHKEIKMASFFIDMQNLQSKVPIMQSREIRVLLSP
jgi:hypothetical protein